MALFLIDRLLGASLVVPFVHYWWPCLPANLSRVAMRKLLLQDQWTFRVAHYAPWLFYWWFTQKVFPSLSMMTGNMAIFSSTDMEIIKKWLEAPPDGQVVLSVSLRCYRIYLFQKKSRLLQIHLQNSRVIIFQVDKFNCPTDGS